MGYKTNNDMKGERKMGMDAMRAMVNDPGFNAQATLALAQRNKDAFGKIDDLNDVAFVDAMRDMRMNHPNLYPVFWWWRDAEVKAGRRQETDSDQPESRFRTFMVTQFLRAPFSDGWEDNRQTLKPGVDPWITEKKIAEGLDHKTVKRWAWVWHDRDIYTEEDEIADRNGQVKTGERKFKHVHIMLDVPAKVPISTVARWFGVPPQQVTVMRGRGAFLDGVEYLLHESPRAVEQHKTHYDDDEIHASPGFDFRKELTDLQAHRAKYGKRAGEMTPADTMRMHVLHDGWTMKMCRVDDPLTYSHISNTLKPLRLDYLLDQPPCGFRLVIYVDGPTGIGKTSFCRYIPQAFFPDEESPCFEIGNDSRVTFDGYDGQPAVIFHEVRAAGLIATFGREGVFRLLDPYPGKEAQQAKHTRVILCNKLTILNGIEPYSQFISGLAGTYTDKAGVLHMAEDEGQAWRRVPLILCVRMDDFTVLVNKGFVNDDASSMKSFYQFAHVRGRMKYMMEKLSGAARETALVTFGNPVRMAAKMIEDARANQISDPALIPPEIMPSLVYQAGSFEQAGRDEDARKNAEELEAAIEEADQYEMARTDAIIEFACWFWSSVNGGFACYYDDHPAEWKDAESEIRFLQDDAELKKAIRKCRRYFSGSDSPVRTRSGNAYCKAGDLVRTLSVDELLEPVRLAWWDYFGVVPPLTADRGYDSWKARVIENVRGEGHKYCRGCRRIFPLESRFCSLCGKTLPNDTVYGDIEFVSARIHLADERGCDVADVPDEDVTALVYKADGHDCGIMFY